MAKSKKSTKETAVETTNVEVVETPKPTVESKVRMYQVAKAIGCDRKGQVQQVVNAFRAIEAGTGEPVAAKDVTDELLRQCDGKYKIHIIFRQEGRFANWNEANQSVLFHLHVLAREGYLREFDALELSDGTVTAKATRAKALVLDTDELLEEAV
jgi:hypothetical protein